MLPRYQDVTEIPRCYRDTKTCFCFSTAQCAAQQLIATVHVVETTVNLSTVGLTAQQKGTKGFKEQTCLLTISNSRATWHGSSWFDIPGGNNELLC